MKAREKQYSVHFAKLREDFDGQKFWLVLIPWKHYQNQLAGTAYGHALQAVNVTSVIAAKSPTDGLVYYETPVERMLRRFLDKNPPEKIRWEPLLLEDKDGWIEALDKQ